MKSIFQVRRPLTGCEHIWWTEKVEEIKLWAQFSGTLTTNASDNQMNRGGWKIEEHPRAKWQWYWFTNKCDIWYSDIIDNRVLFWCILCYRCLFCLQWFNLKKRLPLHYHLALINYDANDDDDEKHYLLDSQSFQLMGDGCDIISWHKVGPEVPARQKRQESGCPSDTKIMMMM